MNITAEAESLFEQRCDKLLKSAALRCDYRQWHMAYEGLVKICNAYGKRYDTLDGSGEFQVLSDWFEVRELCLKEVQVGFVTNQALSAMHRYLGSLAEHYVLLISPDDIFAQHNYSILMYGGEAWATFTGCASPVAVKHALAGQLWAELVKAV